MVRNAVEKTENEYRVWASKLISTMRRDGDLPWSWIVDETRRTREHETYDGPGEALAVQTELESRCDEAERREDRHLQYALLAAVAIRINLAEDAGGPKAPRGR